VLPEGSRRPHVLLTELELYVDHLEKDVARASAEPRRQKWLGRYGHGLEAGIGHLRELAAQVWIAGADEFLGQLDWLEARIRVALDSALAGSLA
jgi:hypothetical protein